MYGYHTQADNKACIFLAPKWADNLVLWTLSSNTYEQKDGTTSLDYSFVPLKTNSNPFFDTTLN